MSQNTNDKGGMSRRGLLGGALGSGALGLAAVAGAKGAQAEAGLEVPDWSRELGPGVVDRPYGSPAVFEKDVVRRWMPFLQPAPETSVSFTPLQDLHGTITPNGLFFERHHGGRADIDPARHQLMINGLVERPLIFSMADLKRFEPVSRVHFIECGGNTALEWRRPQINSVQFSHGMIANCEWTGVPLKAVLERAELKPGAKWLLVEGADASGYAKSIPLEKALDDALLAYAQNGEALRPEQGYPLRLVFPGWEGSLNVKWVRRIEVGDKPWYTREETARYSDLMEDGKARAFSFVQEAKSIITSPSPENPLDQGVGPYVISGLAWSGRGKIKAVDVSVDGGVNWSRATLVAPVHSKALTRFTLPWQWDGSEALLQSRAIDETGYVQPGIPELKRVRGTNSIYHNNMIFTWRVGPDGKVNNVQLD